MLEAHKTRIVAAYIRSAIAEPALCRDQTDKCSEYSVRTFGKEPDLLFCDQGASGVKECRPQLGQLSKCIRLGRVHMVIASDLSRIHRSISRMITFFALLRDYDVTLHSVSDGGPIDLDACSFLMPPSDLLMKKSSRGSPRLNR